VKLSETQQEILSVASLQANSTASEIGAQCGRSEAQVRYTLDSLRRSKLVRTFPVINIHSLGYTDYCIFLTFEPGKLGGRSRLLTYLCDSPNTAWVAELAGEYSHTVSLFAKNIGDVDIFLVNCAKAMRGGIIKKSFAIRESWTLFPFNKKQASSRAKVRTITRESKVNTQGIDELDWKILECICNHPDEPSAAQARRLKIPPATFIYRLKQLSQRHILLGHAIYVESHLLGLYAYRILILERSVSPDLRKRLFDFAAKHLKISSFVHCVGDWDYELTVEVASPPDLLTIVDEIDDCFGAEILTIKTTALLNTTKIDLFPFQIPKAGIAEAKTE